MRKRKRRNQQFADLISEHVYNAIDVSITREMMERLGDPYGDAGKLDAQRAYAEAETDWKVEVAYVQYAEGVLTNDEFNETVAEAHAATKANEF
jgi:hypothetical protein